MDLLIPELKVFSVQQTDVISLVFCVIFLKKRKTEFILDRIHKSSGETT